MLRGGFWTPSGPSDMLFVDGFEDPDTGDLGTSGYARLWTDTTTSGAGMHRLATDPGDSMHFLVGSTAEGDDGERLVLMQIDGTAAWARDTSSVFSAANSPAFLDDGSGGVVFVGVLASSGSGQARAMQFAGATGADGIESPTDPAGGPDDARVVPGSDRVWFHEGGSAGNDELFLWEVSTNTFLANATTINDPAVGSMAALSDSGCLIVDNVTDELVRLDMTGSEVWRKPLQTAAGGTTFRIESQANGAKTLHLEESQGHAYVAVRTTGGAPSGAYILRLDIADGMGGTVVTGNLDPLTADTSANIKTIRRDRFGGWWLIDADSSSWDVLRFGAAWGFVHSIRSTFPDNPMFSDHGSGSVVRDIALLGTDRLILMSGEDNHLSGYSIE